MRPNMLQGGAAIIEDPEEREATQGCLRGSLLADVVRDLLAAGLAGAEFAGLFREPQV